MHFLDRIFQGRKSLIEFVRRAVGYTLTGNVAERCLFICHGEGANGKSTLLQVIEALTGDYALRMWTVTLMAKRNNGIPNDVASLRGRRFLFASETAEGSKLDEGFIKDLTGGDTITGRFLHQEFISFKPQGKVWLSTNHKPEIRGRDRAIWDRIRLIPFDEVIPEGERDRHFPEKLVAELPGILNWALEGCLIWQKNGLGISEEVKAATAGYKDEMDILAPFLEDRCEAGDGYRVKVGDLKQAYESWCETNHERPLAWRLVSARLKERGGKPKGGRERSWEGLRLKDIPKRDDG